LISWEKDLADENESFDTATKNYEELTAEFAKELDACNEALAVINSAQFSLTISSRINDEAGAGLAHGR